MHVRPVALALTSFGLTLGIAATAAAQPPRASSAPARTATTTTTTAATTAATATTVMPAPASAPQAGNGCSEGGAARGSATVRYVNGQRVVVADDVICVPGERQAPYLFVESGRSSAGYTYADTRVGFTHEVVRAVRQTPF